MLEEPEVDYIKTTKENLYEKTGGSDGSVYKVLTMQAWESAFDPQDPCLKKEKRKARCGSICL